MSAYQRLLTLASRDYLLMLGDLYRIQKPLTQETEVSLCIDDDGDHVGWSLVRVDCDRSYWHDRVCGTDLLSIDCDLREVLDSLLNQCLEKLISASGAT
jgi:hypothetical protein